MAGPYKKWGGNLSTSCDRPTLSAERIDCPLCKNYHYIKCKNALNFFLKYTEQLNFCVACSVEDLLGYIQG